MAEPDNGLSTDGTCMRGREGQRDEERERERQPTQISFDGVHYVSSDGDGRDSREEEDRGIERKPTVRKTELKGCGGVVRRGIRPSRRATFSLST